MDHRRIEEDNIADLYATGRLPADDEEEFEIHLLECRECRERVALADDLRDSYRQVASEDAARATAQLGALAWLAGRSRAARLGLLAVLLLALALPAWLLFDRARLERELAAARSPAETPAPVPPVHGNGAELERLAQEKSRLEGELRRELAARESLTDRIARLTRPQINAAVYSLGLVRGEDETAANVIDLGPTPEWIVLSLELPDSRRDTYKATLLDAGGAVVWQGDGLRPTASDTLNVLVYSDLLRPGSYRMGLQEVGEIPFRVRRRG